MSILQLIWDKLIQMVKDPTQYDLGVAIALFALVVSFLSFLYNKLKARRVERLKHRLATRWFDEETIKESTRYYIQPDCCSIDPSH